MKCTWVDCINTATKPQLNEQGNQWANLCDEHHEQIQKAIEELDVKALVSAWVKASGGAKKLASTF